MDRVTKVKLISCKVVCIVPRHCQQREVSGTLIMGSRTNTIMALINVDEELADDMKETFDLVDSYFVLR